MGRAFIIPLTLIGISLTYITLTKERFIPSRTTLEEKITTAEPNTPRTVTEAIKESNGEQKETRDVSTPTTTAAAEAPLPTPFRYPEEVGLRVMLLTFDRPASLVQCLHHIAQLDMSGDSLAVEIWVDRAKDGHVDNETVTVAHETERNWTKGVLRVHVREKHVGIVGQWVTTWKPRENSSELGLIVEDDTDVSPLAYKWLRGVYSHVGHHANLSGVTLQTQYAKFKVGEPRKLEGPASERGFFYGVTGTWGFSPCPAAWLRFQDWLPKALATGEKPYVKGLRASNVYSGLERLGQEDSIWAVWHHYFNYVNHLYCFYSNLKTYTNNSGVLLSWNRMEKGLHFPKGSGLGASSRLLEEWSEDYVHFPSTTLQFSLDGNLTRRI